MYALPPPHTPLKRRWHHIYLPLLPKTFKDYLTAPMPFLVGLPAQLLPVLKDIPMCEVTLIDLDLARCDPAPGSARDDANNLPYKRTLEAALQAAYSTLRSPTEYESSPLIAGAWSVWVGEGLVPSVWVQGEVCVCVWGGGERGAELSLS